jgi:hypothetical protein
MESKKKLCNKEILCNNLDREDTEVAEDEDGRMKSVTGIGGYSGNQYQRATIFCDGNYMT